MKSSTEQDYRERIVRTLLYIQDHLDDELDLERLASVAAFSRFHFHRIFRGLTGETVKEHVRRLRLERAARSLRQGEEPVTQIALRAGFESAESFTRAFGEMFGVAPSAYRAAHRPRPESSSGTHFGEVAGYHPPDYPAVPAVEVKQLARVSVVFLRHVGPYDQMGGAWGRLMMWAGMHGLLGPSMRLIGIAHDDPDISPAEKIRYDAAVVTARAIAPEGDFGVTEIAGGRYAIAHHKGPYGELGNAYQALFGGWLPRSGYQVRDVPAFEEYLNSPQNTRPEDLLTRIHIPLEDD